MDPPPPPGAGPDDPTLGVPQPGSDSGSLRRQEARTAVRRAHRLHYITTVVRDELEAYYQRPEGTYPVLKALAERGLGPIEQAVLTKDFQTLERRELLLTPTLAKVRPLAEGGMGVVWLGWDAELDRSLAIKVIKRFTATSAQRFEREARAMALVGNHPHCLSVHHVGLSNLTGEPYFSMPLIPDSRTLGTLIEDANDGGQPLPAPEAVARWGYQVALALQACHDARLIHRDVKPSNVLIDPQDHALLTDFGVVSDLDTETLLTQHQSIVGTFHYMPIEQLRGDDVDPRADLYALGATLYHALTGQVPHPCRSLAELVAKGVQGEVTPPSTLRPDLPPPLEQILLRCLRKDRDERYPSAHHLAQALLQLLPTASDVLLPTSSASGRTLQPSARSRAPWPWFVGGLLTGGLAAAAGTWAALRGPAPPRPDTDTATQLAAANAQLEALTAEQAKNLVYVDRAKLELLTEQATTGLPYASSAVPAMQTWLQEARALASRRPFHRKQLEALENRSNKSEATRKAALEQLLQGLDRLTKLFPATQYPTPDTIASVEQRLAFAQTVRHKTIESPEAQAAWTKAIAAIKANPRYNGWTLKGPIEGLLPLGPDPKSGLWEFWHLATGERPVQDREGHWRLTVESGLVLVLIPGGTTLSTGEPIQPFLNSKYEFTQGQWLRVTGDNPSEFKPGSKPMGGQAFTLLHPVEQIDWNSCRRTLTRLSLRLPREAEWEYSTRGGTRTRWWTGDRQSDLRSAANLADQKFKRFSGDKSEDWDDGFTATAPVGRFRANAFGLHDVAGNLWELAQSDSTADLPRLRGGSWTRDASWARSEKRIPMISKWRDIGVRPSRSCGH